MRICTFYLDSGGLQAYQYNKGEWLLSGCFSNTTEGHREFAAFLRARPLDAYQILANLPHEQIQPESIPAVRGNDRDALIQRRLEQHFPANTLRMAASAGQKSGKENLLLSAFNSATAFTPWLQELDKDQLLLQGIYSASQLCASLLHELVPAGNHDCLLYVLDGGSLHQYFLRDEHAYLHRVLALPTGKAEWLVQETNKLKQYLLTQQLIPYNEPLPLFVLGKLPDQLIKPEENFFELPIQKTIPQLFLDTLRTHRPKHNFAGKKQLAPGKLARTRLHVALMTGVVCLGTFGGAAYLSLENGRLEEATKTLLSAAKQLEQEASPPNETAALPALRQLNARHQAFQRMQKQPRADLRWLSQALDKNTDIHLDKIDWYNDTGKVRLRIEAHTDANLDNPQQKIGNFIAALNDEHHRRIRREPLNLSTSGSLRSDSMQAPQMTGHRFILHVGEHP